MGLRPLSRDISSGFSDSLFFPSALFNSLVRYLGRSSDTYSGSRTQWVRHQLTAVHRTAEAARPDHGTGRCGPVGSFSDKAFHEVLAGIDNRTTLLLGHTRRRTHGDEKVNVNNRPIWAGAPPPSRSTPLLRM